ncbi:MAG: S1 RNA-binding domain-containing protein [Acidimicrobiales bacterium]
MSDVEHTLSSSPEPEPEASPVIGATSQSADVAVPHNPRPVAETATLVTGVVTGVSADEVEVALRDGRPAVIYRRDIDEAGSEPSSIFSIGDTAEGAELRRDDPKKRVVLSRTWALKQIKWKRILDAKADGTLLDGLVTGVSGKGVVVDVGVRGFVPASHLALEPVSDLSAFAGQTLQLKVLEVDAGRERLVLSRRSVLMREQRKETHDALAGLAVGSVIDGTVKSITNYGAFVDVGGITGLVHLSECSWKRLRSATEVVSVGDVVKVKVLDVKIKKRRVSLSLRQVADDPLLAIEAGTVIEGPVARLVEFGAFVDVGDIEGLVHLTELAEYRVSVPEEVVTPGEVVRVKVLSVDRKRRRIELSIRQAVSIPFGD